MNEEIEKLLDRLERIDHKEYSCNFDFADSSSFDEVCMCFEERKILANYVKELQQKNKKIKENWEELKKWINANDEHYSGAIPFRQTIRKMKELESSDSDE